MFRIAALAAFLAPTATCQASEILWLTGVGSYASPGNWLGSNLPSVAYDELASINNGGTAQLASIAGVSPGGVKIARASSSFGKLEILAGGSLSVTAGAGVSKGQIDVGTTNGGGALRIWPGGSFTAGGVLTLSAPLGNRVEVGDDAGGAATLSVGAASLAGTTTLHPGGVLTAVAGPAPGATGGVTLAATSLLATRLSSAGSGRLAASGAIALGGSLEVTLAVGYVPSAGATYDLFDGASVSGTFSSISLPALDPSLVWNASQLNATGVLKVGYAGDFDLDGDVDGGDLLVWQGGGSPSPNSVGDLAIWKTSFGAVTAETLVSASVPEPGVGGAMLLAALPWQRRLFVRSNLPAAEAGRRRLSDQ
jgi:hypothetical protein